MFMASSKNVYCLWAEGCVILDRTEYFFEAFVAAWEIVYFSRERAFIKKIIWATDADNIDHTFIYQITETLFTATEIHDKVKH
jgi:hypothetical protein